MYRKFLIVLFLIFNTSVSINGDVINNPWTDFFEKPNSINFRLCEEQIRNRHKEKSIFDFTSNEIFNVDSKVFFNNLYDLMAAGNIYACDLAFQLYKLFKNNIDVIEELTIQIGQIVEIKPQLFLEMIKKHVYHNQEKYNLDNLLCAFGDEYVDRFSAQVDKALYRVKRLECVNDINYKNEKKCVFVAGRIKMYQKWSFKNGPPG